MKHISQWTKYLAAMAVVFFALFIINMGILAGIHNYTREGKLSPEISEIAGQLSENSNTYIMSEDGKDRIDRLEGFAMLLGDTGEILWEYRLPSELFRVYTMKDVASFSRWYLGDYPVYTWVTDAGILVLGLPKESLWKYNLIYERGTIEALLQGIPVMFILDLLMLVFLPFYITKRWNTRMEKERTEWIAGVSHDIRTPLALVLGNAVSIRNGDNPQEIQKCAEIIEGQALRIRQLVSNLNTENKLSFGIGKWNKEKFAVAAVIREVLCDFVNRNTEGKYLFGCIIDADLEDYTIYTDEGLFRRMLENLIHNAIQHNPEGCRIRVSLAEAKGKKAELRICDNVVGISAEILKGLNHKLNDKALPEHGLGLRVVKKIAGKYHWKIRFESVPGKGFCCSIKMKTSVK